MVTLELNGQKVELEESHAQRILQVQSGNESLGGVLPEKFILPDDSPYEFVGNGLRLKHDKGTSKKAGKREPVPEGEGPL